MIGSAWTGVASTYERLRSATAAIIAAVSSTAALLVTRPGQWTATSAPAIGVIATVTKAAGGAGTRHVCTSIHATFNTTATAGAAVNLALRDGATGVGAALWNRRLIVPANQNIVIDVTGLNIVGSDNTAMTFEFTAAPPADGYQSVALCGHSAT